MTKSVWQKWTNFGRLNFYYKYRGGGSATATTAMAVPILKQKVGVVNVETLKRAWHSLSRACTVCTLEKELGSRRAISTAGRALVSSQLEVDGTDLPECLHQPGSDFSFPKRSLGKKLSFSSRSNMSGFQNGLSSIILRLRTQFSALPVGRCSRKRRIRPLLKPTLPL